MHASTAVTSLHDCAALQYGVSGNEVTEYWDGLPTMSYYVHQNLGDLAWAIAKLKLGTPELYAVLAQRCGQSFSLIFAPELYAALVERPAELVADSISPDILLVPRALPTGQFPG